MMNVETMHQNVNSTKTQDTDAHSNSDGTWLLITSTMGLTLGYVRIDDHDHRLSLSEIRDMIHDKLKDNTEYCHGFNFGTGWPLKIVNKEEEHTVLAQDVLPSVSVLSTHSAQHIVNTNNPISAATAMQYGMTPQSILNMNFMGFPSSVSTANIHPLPISAIFTPIPADQLPKPIGSTGEYYSPNTVALLQPQPQRTDDDTNAVKTESAHPVLSAHSITSNAQIPSLPPFSPPAFSQRDIEHKQKTQKEKLQNLLPISKQTKTEHRVKTPKNEANRNKPNKPVMLPRLKPMDVDGHVIEKTQQKEEAQAMKKKKKKKKNMTPPNKQAQKDLFCPECEKTFGSERGYRMHMTKQHQIKLARGRNKERRFRCDHDGCDRCFYQSSDLRRHQRVHLGVKPFKCSAFNCGKEFTQRGSLYRHIKSSHKGQDPKSLIILQTEQTLPGKQKQSISTTSKNDDDLPPAITDDLPPQVTVSQNSNIGLPPPLITNATTVNENDKQEKGDDNVIMT
eukprot:32798_1